MDKILETKTCKQCSTHFDITQDDRDFYTKISLVFGGKKYQIPDPTLCPECRQQRRLNFRNERKLYRRKCDATGTDIISMYSPDSKIKVYREDVWWGDGWDPFYHGKEFDFTRNFFDQFGDLFYQIPQPPLINNYLKLENSQYSNYSGNLNDCYLAYECGSCESMFYGESNRHVISSFDLSMSTRCEQSYFCFDCFDSTSLYFSSHSSNCSHSYYLKNCKNCSYCFNCENISGKKYCIDNIEYSEEEYLSQLSHLNKGFQEDLFYHYASNQVPVSINSLSCENVSGDYIYNSKDVHNSYHVKNLDGGKYCSYLSSSSKKSQDCYDYDYFGGAQRTYESIMVGSGSQDIFFCFNVWEGSYKMLYCAMCYGCKNCFGCVGLRFKEYCICNKQYSKDEYEFLLVKIIQHMQKTGEWGEFFPSSFSGFGYNETLAQEYFPLSHGEAREQGYNWSDYEAPFSKVDKIILAHKLPEDITDIPDDILNWAIECEVTKKPFRIIRQELEFYRKHQLPIPKRHPDQRYMDRMKLRNPRKLFKRNCDKCKKEIQTTCSPERSEKVCCELCYNSEI